jgi:hypothetical protein
MVWNGRSFNRERGTRASGSATVAVGSGLNSGALTSTGNLTPPCLTLDSGRLRIGADHDRRSILCCQGLQAISSRLIHMHLTTDN